MPDLLILCYHAIAPDWPATLSVRPDAFEQQLDRLVAKGYRGTTFTRALRGPRSRRQLVVTFDDAYTSVLERAKPLMDRYGIPGTLYVPTDWPGRTEPMCWAGIGQWLGTEHEAEMHALDWAQLRGLADAGWEIGSHTRSHPRLTGEPDDALRDELVVSKAVLERELGRPCESIAYPYGDVDDRVAAAAARAGYVAGCSLPRARELLVSRNALQWPRTPIHRIDTPRRFGLKVSVPARRLQSSPTLGALAGRVGAR